jgi:xanthine dehydrogenase large subunit
MACAMTHAENAYYILNVDPRHGLPHEHAAQHAFRGFGGPQGVATMENILEEIAHVLKKDALEIRRTNCYGVDTRNVTPYHQVLEHNTLPRLFAELTEKCDYAARMKAATISRLHSETSAASRQRSSRRTSMSSSSRSIRDGPLAMEPE